MADRRSLALVCEDTDLGRWALTRALETEGYEVRAVSTWAEASVWLIKARFDLALVTVSSSADAAEVVACIRRHHPHPHLVLMADQDSIGELRLACGTADILVKPLDLEKVAKVAFSHLGPGSETLGV